MEGKKSRAAVASCYLLLVLLLSAQQQQVAAMSKFCRCYHKCYTDCRKSTGRFLCKIKCGRHCGILPAAATTTPADSGDICSMHFCGVMETGADAEECVADCTKNTGAFAPSAAKIN